MQGNRNDQKESEDMKLKICNKTWLTVSIPILVIERYQEREQKEASCKTNIPDGGIRRAQ